MTKKTETPPKKATAKKQMTAKKPRPSATFSSPSREPGGTSTHDDTSGAGQRSSLPGPGWTGGNFN